MSGDTHWWWVRHAPVAGADGRIYGQLDVAADTSDGESFRTLAAILPGDAVWVVTPLRRTRDTARAIAAAGAALPEAIVEPAFSEQNFGRWQGLSWAGMQAADPVAYAGFWQDPTRSAPPGGESYAHHIGRARAAIERLTAAHGGRNIVSISHGGTIRAAVATALALSPDAAMAIVIDNLSITRLSNVGDGLLRGCGGVWLVKGVNMPCCWPVSDGRPSETACP